MAEGGSQKAQHGRNHRHRFKKLGQAKKLKKEDEVKEMESIISRCKELPKINAATFKRFKDFPLSNKTIRGLDECEYEEPTDVQRESLPFSLSGSDVLESLWRSGWSNYCGLGALIISPTRELALQTFTVMNNVGKFHDFSCALLIGGTDVEYERNRLGRVNIIICTPGRLLQHMDENEQLLCDQLQILVLDEADRILDMGFSQQINAIVANLPKERQTLLFSATQTRNVKDLSRDPVFVSAHERCANATPDGLVQFYMVCEEQQKVNTMWSFMVNHKKYKTLMFVSSCKQARFLTGAFCHLRPGLPVMGLWGTMNQKKRVDVFQKFENKEAAVMIATDVASRGLDFSDVDWVIQIDCPASVEDYIHRVGRTARMSQKGHAVLFLTPSQEEPMVAALKKANIPLEKQIADPRALVDIQVKMQATLSQFPELNQYAQKSIVAYLRSIYVMKNKKVFDVTSVDAAALAASYGLVTVPRVRFLSKKGINVKDGKEKNSQSEPTLVDAPPKKKKEEERTSTPSTKPQPAPKVITKLSAAKKLLNKKLKVNVRKVYDEEGEVAKVEGVENHEEGAGLDLVTAKETMKQISVEDRKRHKALVKQRKKEEKERLKRKRKGDRGEDLDLGEGGSGIDSDADLSFLPDPDEVRRRYAEQDSDEEVTPEEPAAPLQKRRKLRKKIMAVSYVPAGRVAVNEFHRRADDDVIYWKRMQQLSVFQEPSSVTSVAFSPNKPYNVASTSSVRLSLYDTVVCEPINLFSRFKRAVYGVKFRADGELIAIGGEEGKVRIFDVTKSSGVGKVPLRSIRASQGSVRCVEFTASGRMVFSMASDGMVKQWDICDTGSTPVVSFAAHQDEIRSTAISSSNDNLFITGGYDHKVKLWDSRCFNDGPGIEMDAGFPVENVTFLNTEHLIATAAGPVVKIWDVAVGGRLLTSLQYHHKSVTSLCLGAKGDVLLTGAIDRRVNVVRLLDFSLLHSMSMAAPVLSMAVAPDDQTIAVGMGQLLAVHRRQPEIKALVTAQVFDKRSVIRTAAPKVQMQEAGKPKETVELTAKSKVYANEDLDPKVAKLALGLRTAVAKELTVQKQLAQTLGALESIISAARVSSLHYEPLQSKEALAEQGMKELSTKEGDPLGLFGEPTIGSVTLDLLDKKES
ncbi:unnamed protein product [Nippostrongylus brasiliensis]|uniref:ATP-dependent RNA helicase n=1 Tax=Nippostrongylus brasiliensis TaxID=27835 RepID=A0A0N4YF75_NIPBR|nr:unnamed protein product [Nippostrongylus brasiliensis]